MREAQRDAHIGSFEGQIAHDDLWWSEELYCLFGLEASRFQPTKDRFSDLLHPDDRVEYLDALMGSLETGEAFTREYRAKHADGDWRHFETIATVTFDDAGKPRGLRGTVQDITARKRVERKLLNSEHRFRVLVETAPVCIHEIDLEGRISSMNPAGLAMLGVEHERDVCGMRYLDAMCRLDYENFDLVISDIVMPERDGLEVIMFLRKQHPATNVIAISAPGNGVYLQSARGLGAHRVFRKPFELAEIANAAEELLLEA
jgi:PAS domain S-box-containing protein